MSNKLPICLFSKTNNKIGDLSVYDAKQLIRYNLVDISKTDSIRLSLKEEVANFELKSLTKKRKKKTDINYINSLDRSVYGNYAFFSPEGFFMFYTSAERMLWYLYNDLADIINSNPYEFKLKFVPKGYGHYGRDNPFYLSKLKNVCVVCGSDTYLSKHHLVPYCYRKHMAETIKCANHHDVLLLCTEHHKEYEEHAAKEKKNICVKYGFERMHIQDKAEIELNNIRRFANVLNAYYDVIPEQRRNILIGKFENLTNQKFSKELCLTFTNVKYQGKRESTFNEIVKRLDSEQKLKEFIVFWRKHFIAVMNPQFMPEGWNIDNDICRKS